MSDKKDTEPDAVKASPRGGQILPAAIILGAVLALVLLLALFDQSDEEVGTGARVASPPASEGFGGIQALKASGGHEETIKEFRDFHYQMHLINKLLQSGEIETIGQVLPFFKRYKEILLEREGPRATKGNGYQARLEAFSWHVDDFVVIFQNRRYGDLRGAFKRMHERYDVVRAQRPGGMAGSAP